MSLIKNIITSFSVLFMLLSPQSIMAADDCDITLIEQLRNCTPYKCNMVHPQFQGAKIKHNIIGMQDDGKCHYEQDLPMQQDVGKTIIILCKYDAKTLIAAANVLKGAFGDDTSTAEEKNLLNKSLQDGVCTITGL